MIIRRRDPDYTAINKQVEEEFRCSHSDTIRCKKVKANGDVEFRNQCKKCGDKVGNAIRKATLTEKEMASLPPWDNQIGIRFASSKHSRQTALVAQDKQRSLAEWNAQYDAYRKTPEWQARRQLVLKRAGGICEGCLSAPATEVHHLYYDSLGEEFLFDLVAICDKCHSRFHGRMDNERRS